MSQTVGLTKVLLAPIVYLALVYRTLGVGYTDAGDRPQPEPEAVCGKGVGWGIDVVPINHFVA